ncbi:hypothetical protein E4U17_003202 [Claviceps sp. LM77 group G4]|nr:hypothetical protein E4U17_003202 [Claviceps sp. LM77 group G4]KAG6056505.1 hypothetical protein E4U33_007678 [Claviceps sp. LM78 group G4]KAG6076399.1 hypothetical protein E4U16_002798 [Claviceps sp. LM84 group G4]
MLLHRYLALLFASTIPSSALSLPAKASAFNYKRPNVTIVTSVRSNHTTTSCNSNTTSTPIPIDPSYLMQHTADQVIKHLNLSIKAEGGYFRQTFEDPDKVPGSNRSLSTSMYYLIRGVEGPSKWHRVDVTEVWHYYAGAPLILHQVQRFENGSTHSTLTDLGPRMFQEKFPQVPQVVIPKGVWQRAISFGNWTLVGTTGEHLLSQA